MQQPHSTLLDNNNPEVIDHISKYYQPKIGRKDSTPLYLWGNTSECVANTGPEQYFSNTFTISTLICHTSKGAK